MGKTTQQQSRSKKLRVQSPMAMTEEEILKEDEDTGADALVAVEGAAAGVEIMVRIAKARLHCPICMLPLKPPIFQCAVGHLACGVCRELPGDGRCFTCGHTGGAYARSTPLEAVVRATRIQCPYDAYGCRSYVTYYHAGDHAHACPHAPCLCTEPGCGGFAGPPAALRDHMRDAHSWPVDAIRYGAALQLRVPEADPAQHRRLLVAADEDEEGDGAVFLLAVGAFGDAPLRLVSLVCARPGGAAAVGPRYTCLMRAVGPRDVGTGRDAESAAVELAVPSSVAPGKASMEEAATLVVPRRMLHGAPEEEEMQIGIRIDRIV
nr:unnamed protein product [Digitaria exilis]